MTRKAYQPVRPEVATRNFVRTLQLIDKTVDHGTWHGESTLDRSRAQNLKRTAKPLLTPSARMFPDRPPVPKQQYDEMGHTLLSNSVALKGRMQDVVPTHPRLPSGEVMPLIDMSIGSFNAGSDISTTSVGQQQCAIKPGFAALTHKIPTYSSF